VITLAVLLTCGTRAHAQATEDAGRPKLLLAGDTALLTVAIRPDKVADFERVMRRMRDALLSSGDRRRQEQAAGWTIMKLDQPLPDGNVAFVHIIDPVVAGMDYSVMQTLYDAFPNERLVLYELYRGAFVKNLSLATGTIVLRMGEQAPTSAPTQSTPPPATASPLETGP
jgi:hypothetical protein